MTEKTVAPQICLKCKDLQRNCCTLPIELTLEDMKNISSFGFDLLDFIILQEHTDKEMEDYEEWWKRGTVEIEGKKYKIVAKKREDGSCVFLSDKEGCVLGQKRPCVCKIFPFWLDDETREIIYEPGEPFCFLENNNLSVKEGIKLIEETEVLIKNYYEKMAYDGMNNNQEYKKIALEIFKCKKN